MSVVLQDPEKKIQEIIGFIRDTLVAANKEKVIVAVSGGIDSALSLSLVVWAIGRQNVFALFMPFAEQNMDDAKKLADWLEIPKENQREVNILSIVKALKKQAQWKKTQSNSQVRLGNMMARSRMIVLYDWARELDALVGGTENLSEHHLGYFTRFGDEASDFEPIRHLLKSQVRQMVEYLGLPEVFLTKAPSAGLWAGQTDEKELGFDYATADIVIDEILLNKKTPKQVKSKHKLDEQVINKVLAKIDSVQFKHQVPFKLISKN